MSTPANNRPKNNEQPGDQDVTLRDAFQLEDVFEDVSQVFKPSKVQPASNAGVMIAVDTNVLLLPYTIRNDRLPRLQDFYSNLRKNDRLFLPARVAREFLVHRDKKLAELLKTIRDIKSKVTIGKTKVSPILEGVEGSDDLSSANDALAAARDKYMEALSAIEGTVRSWAGDDPVSRIYEAVFDSSNIISPAQSKEVLLSEWRSRAERRMPPGYKDLGKEDSGIGDYLIWKSLLGLGEAEKKDLIFVTGDEKADWFIRVDGGGAYPRPELIAEYRKYSGGKSLRLASMHDVLREMDAPDEFVDEVANAETVVRVTLTNRKKLIHTVVAPVDVSSRVELRLPYGGQQITFKTIRMGIVFDFNVSEREQNTLWAYPNSNFDLYLLPGAEPGQAVELIDADKPQTPFLVRRGQMIGAKDTHGNVLIARLESANKPDPGDVFEIQFSFHILPKESRVTAP